MPTVTAIERGPGVCDAASRAAQRAPANHSYPTTSARNDRTAGHRWASGAFAAAPQAPLGYYRPAATPIACECQWSTRSAQKAVDGPPDAASFAGRTPGTGTPARVLERGFPAPHH